MSHIYRHNEPFTLESGAVLPSLEIAYDTFGELNEAKDILAYELTKLVHSEEEADKARAASKALFAGGGDAEHMPTTELTNDDFGGGSIDIMSLMVKCGLAPSRGEARRLVQQGGVTVNDEKVTAIDAVSYTHLTLPTILLV